MKIVKRNSLEKVTRYIILILIFVVFGVTFVLSDRHEVKASSFSWMSGDIHVNQGGGISSRSSDYKRYGDCNGETIERAGYFSAYNGACVFQAKSYRYTIIDGTLYISVGGDKKFYATGSGFASWNYVVPSPETNDFVFNSVVWRDLLSHVTFINSGTPHYEIDVPYKNITTDDQGNGHSINTVTVSRNGRWEMAYIQNLGFVRIDLVDMSVTWIAPMLSTGSNAFTAISNDGKYVAIAPFSPYEWPIIYTIDNCGQNASKLQSGWFGSTLSNPCQSRNLHSLISTAIGGPFTVGYWPDFSDDGGQLKMLLQLNNGEKGVLLSAAGYNFQTSRLDYLALGDSYSSGEGDTERISTTNLKWYRDHTDVDENVGYGIPKEKCHISLRSYPYKLARFMELPRRNWNTIACSGAVGYDINPLGVPPSDYLGQAKGDKKKTPRLKDYSNASELKSTALNEFIPGRNAQIEYVKKYKPKVITLTMGGNDVGFADKIYSCIQLGTCEFAKQSYRQKLKNELRDMYGDLKALYQQLYDASGGQSKIYVLGYPQFISGNENATCSNTFNLNADERKMIFNSVEYFNNVVEQAAKKVGVKYIDIENALGNRKLCEDAGAYVTAITGVLGWNGNDLQESFHPNAKGHEAIAMHVKGALNNQSLLDYSWCPGPVADVKLCPDSGATQDTIPTPSNGYFDEGAPTSAKLKKRQAVDMQVEKSTLIDIKLDSYSGKSGSSFTATLHSDPVHIGDLVVAADGSIDTQITIPATVPAGYHTLTLAGETYSGEPIEYYQSVLVIGSDPDDLDENNTPDSQQPCGPFLQASGVDVDLDGIDDACDPEISTSPQLYRLRQGDPTRTYAGQPEKAHYLYIERNTRASSITGITGDYDPDGDGWAIVGASQGKEYTATSVPDTAPAANFTITGDGTPNSPYAPIISLRAGGWGCVQYKPTSLSKVTASQSRTLTRIATNTNTCRQEPPEDDVDGNGKPDNIQPLYTARSGDSAKGEDPDRLYLYRNFHAAETRLGISDYTPTGTAANTIAALPLIPTISTPPNDPIFGRSQEPIQAWNLLATSKAGEPIPQFNKLVIIDDNGTPSPIILTKNQNGQCIAYKPQNVGIIKFNQQNSLIKTTNTPQGESCD